MSKLEIVSRLKDFWEQEDTSITMAKLSGNKNRFVAAGIFFELMGECGNVKDSHREVLAS